MLFLSYTNMSFQVCREWEARALEVNKNVRLVLIRIGVVLGKDGGALGIALFHTMFYDICFVNSLLGDVNLCLSMHPPSYYYYYHHHIVVVVLYESCIDE